jgi:polyisoprenoid-binding protein YceI
MPLETWNIDTSHSSLTATVRHMVIAKVHARFNRWSGAIVFDEENMAATRAEVHIATAGIDTHEERRDAHLRSADFLDAERYPEIVFSARAAEVTGLNRFRLSGDLTIRGITRTLDLEAGFNGRIRDPWGGERVAFEARTTFDRADYGMTWNAALEAGGWLVGDEVRVTVEIEAVKAEPA